MLDARGRYVPVRHDTDVAGAIVVNVELAGHGCRPPLKDPAECEFGLEGQFKSVFGVMPHGQATAMPRLRDRAFSRFLPASPR
jgi:hypothetical protein